MTHEQHYFELVLLILWRTKKFLSKPDYINLFIFLLDF